MSLKVIHKDTERNVALVQGKNTFPVRMMDWLKFLVCVGDTAIVKKSVVTGEWVMTDYIRYVDNNGGF